MLDALVAPRHGGRYTGSVLDEVVWPGCHAWDPTDPMWCHCLWKALSLGGAEVSQAGDLGLGYPFGGIISFLGVYRIRNNQPQMGMFFFAGFTWVYPHSWLIILIIWLFSHPQQCGHPRQIIVDVGAHEWSRFLPELRRDPKAWLVLVEPGRSVAWRWIFWVFSW